MAQARPGWMDAKEGSVNPRNLLPKELPLREPTPIHRKRLRDVLLPPRARAQHTPVLYSHERGAQAVRDITSEVHVVSYVDDTTLTADRPGRRNH